MPSELERMLSGQLYDPMDPQLVRMRERARELSWALNATLESQQVDRRRVLTELLGSGGNTALVQPPFFCDYGSNIHLGERVYFNFNCVVLDVSEVRIGSYTMFGPAVQLLTAMHPLDAVARRKREYSKPITIGQDCWLGGGAIVCPGVTIGEGTVIGAGSVVTRDIPSGVLAVGNPCRVLREIGDNE